MKKEKGPLTEGWKKGTALFVAVLFTFTTVAWSAPAPFSIEARGKGREIRGLPFVEEITIPESLARVEEKYVPRPDSSRPDFATLVHIQDAHSSYEAQNKIKELLQHLTKNHGFKLILLEGGSGKLNPGLLRFFSDQALNYKVADLLAQKAEVGGAELFLVNSEFPQAAFGIEDERLYWANLLNFRRAMARGEESDTFLLQSKNALNILGSHYFNQSLRDFLKEWMLFRDSPAELLRHLGALQKAARKELNLDLTDPWNQREWPNLIRVLKLKEIEKQTDVPAAKREKEKLFLWSQTKKIDKEFSEGIDAYFEPPRNHESRKEPRKFLERFYEKAKPSGFQFKDYPALSHYLAFYTLQNEVDARGLIGETEKLTDLILEKLAQTGPEKTLVALLKDHLVLRKLFSLELTREEFDRVVNGKDRFQPSRYAQRILNLGNGKTKIGLTRLPEIDEIFGLALAFYEGTLKRDDAMLENSLRIMKEQGETKAVLVTGGFHSEGLKARFREKEIAYLEVSPKVSKVESENNYLKAIMAEIKFPAPGKFKIKSRLYLNSSPAGGRTAAELARSLQETGFGPRDLLRVSAEEVLDDPRFGRLSAQDKVQKALDFLALQVALYRELEISGAVLDVIQKEREQARAVNQIRNSMSIIIDLTRNSHRTGFEFKVMRGDNGETGALQVLEVSGPAMRRARLVTQVPFEALKIVQELPQLVPQKRSLVTMPKPRIPTRRLPHETPRADVREARSGPNARPSSAEPPRAEVRSAGRQSPGGLPESEDATREAVAAQIKAMGRSGLQDWDELLTLMERYPQYFDRIYLDLDETLFTSKVYLGSHQWHVDEAKYFESGRWRLSAKKSLIEKELVEKRLLRLVESRLVEILTEMKRRNPNLIIQGLTSRRKFMEESTKKIMKSLGLGDLEVRYDAYKGKKVEAIHRDLASNERQERGITLFIDDEAEGFAKHKLMKTIGEMGAVVLLNKKVSTFDMETSLSRFREGLLAEGAAAKGEPQPEDHLIAVLLLSRFSEDVTRRAAIYLDPDIRRFVAAGSDKVKMAYIEASTDFFSRSFEKRLTEEDRDMLLDFYYGLVSFDKQLWKQAHRDGKLTYQMIDRNLPFLHGRGNYELLLTLENAYFFMEPLLDYLVTEKPDVVLLPDTAARPFTESLRYFIEQEGLSTRVINFPISTGDARDTRYELTRWMRLLRGEIPVADEADEKLVAFLRDSGIDRIRSGDKIVIFDDGITRGHAVSMITDVVESTFKASVRGAFVAFDYRKNIAKRRFAAFSSFRVYGEFGARDTNYASAPGVIVRLKWEFDPKFKGVSSRQPYSPPPPSELKDAGGGGAEVLAAFKKDYEQFFHRASKTEHRLSKRGRETHLASHQSQVVNAADTVHLPDEIRGYVRDVFGPDNLTREPLIKKLKELAAAKQGGELVKFLRTQARPKLTQDKLGGLRAVSMIERGKEKVSDLTLGRILNGPKIEEKGGLKAAYEKDGRLSLEEVEYYVRKGFGLATPEQEVLSESGGKSAVTRPGMEQDGLSLIRVRDAVPSWAFEDKTLRPRDRRLLGEKNVFLYRLVRGSEELGFVILAVLKNRAGEDSLIIEKIQPRIIHDQDVQPEAVRDLILRYLSEENKTIQALYADTKTKIMAGISESHRVRKGLSNGYFKFVPKTMDLWHEGTEEYYKDHPAGDTGLIWRRFNPDQERDFDKAIQYLQEILTARPWGGGPIKDAFEADIKRYTAYHRMHLPFDQADLLVLQEIARLLREAQQGTYKFANKQAEEEAKFNMRAQAELLKYRSLGIKPDIKKLYTGGGTKEQRNAMQVRALRFFLGNFWDGGYDLIGINWSEIQKRFAEWGAEDLLDKISGGRKGRFLEHLMPGAYSRSGSSFSLRAGYHPSEADFKKYLNGEWYAVPAGTEYLIQGDENIPPHWKDVPKDFFRSRKGHKVRFEIIDAGLVGHEISVSHIVKGTFFFHEGKTYYEASQPVVIQPKEAIIAPGSIDQQKLLTKKLILENAQAIMGKRVVADILFFINDAIDRHPLISSNPQQVLSDFKGFVDEAANFSKIDEIKRFFDSLTTRENGSFGRSEVRGAATASAALEDHPTPAVRSAVRTGITKEKVPGMNGTALRPFSPLPFRERVRVRVKPGTAYPSPPPSPQRGEGDLLLKEAPFVPGINLGPDTTPRAEVRGTGKKVLDEGVWPYGQAVQQIRKLLAEVPKGSPQRERLSIRLDRAQARLREALTSSPRRSEVRATAQVPNPARTDYLHRLNLLHEIGILKGNVAYPSFGADGFLTLFTDHLYGIDHVTGNYDLAGFNEYLVAALSSSLPEEYKQKQPGQLHMVIADNFDLGAYQEKIQENGPLHALFVKGLTYWLPDEAAGEIEAVKEQGRKYLREMDQLLPSGGFVILAGEKEFYLEEVLTQELGYEDYLAKEAFAEQRKVLSANEPVPTKFFDGQDMITIWVGKIPFKVFQKSISHPRAEVRRNPTDSGTPQYRGLKRVAPGAEVRIEISERISFGDRLGNRLREAIEGLKQLSRLRRIQWEPFQTPRFSVSRFSGIKIHPDNSTTPTKDQMPILRGIENLLKSSVVTALGTRIVKTFKKVWPRALRRFGPSSDFISRLLPFGDIANLIRYSSIFVNSYFWPRAEVRISFERKSLQPNLGDIPNFEVEKILSALFTGSPLLEIASTAALQKKQQAQTLYLSLISKAPAAELEKLFDNLRSRPDANFLKFQRDVVPFLEDLFWKSSDNKMLQALILSFHPNEQEDSDFYHRVVKDHRGNKYLRVAALGRLFSAKSAEFPVNIKLLDSLLAESNTLTSSITFEDNELNGGISFEELSKREGLPMDFLYQAYSIAWVVQLKQRFNLQDTNQLLQLMLTIVEISGVASTHVKAIGLVSLDSGFRANPDFLKQKTIRQILLLLAHEYMHGVIGDRFGLERASREELKLTELGSKEWQHSFRSTLAELLCDMFGDLLDQVLGHSKPEYEMALQLLNEPVEDVKSPIESHALARLVRKEFHESLADTAIDRYQLIKNLFEIFERKELDIQSSEINRASEMKLEEQKRIAAERKTALMNLLEKARSRAEVRSREDGRMSWDANVPEGDVFLGSARSDKARPPQAARKLERSPQLSQLVYPFLTSSVGQAIQAIASITERIIASIILAFKEVFQIGSLTSIAARERLMALINPEAKRSRLFGGKNPFIWAIDLRQQFNLLLYKSQSFFHEIIQSKITPFRRAEVRSDEEGLTKEAAAHITNLSHPDPNVQWNSTSALRALFPQVSEAFIEEHLKGAIPPLITNLSHLDPDVRWNSALALRALFPQVSEAFIEKHHSEIISPLITNLSHPDPDVQLKSAEALLHTPFLKEIEVLNRQFGLGLIPSAVLQTNRIFRSVSKSLSRDYTFGAEQYVKQWIYLKLSQGTDPSEVEKELKETLLPALKVFEAFQARFPMMGMETIQTIAPENKGQVFRSVLLSNYFMRGATPGGVGVEAGSVMDKRDGEIRVLPAPYPLLRLILDQYVSLRILPQDYGYHTSIEGELGKEALVLLMSSFFSDIPPGELQPFVQQEGFLSLFGIHQSYIGATVNARPGPDKGKTMGTQTNIYDKVVSSRLLEKLLGHYPYEHDLERKGLLALAAYAYLKAPSERIPAEEALAKAYRGVKDKLQTFYQSINLTEQEQNTLRELLNQMRSWIDKLPEQARPFFESLEALIEGEVISISSEEARLLTGEGERAYFRSGETPRPLEFSVIQTPALKFYASMMNPHRLREYQRLVDEVVQDLKGAYASQLPTSAAYLGSDGLEKTVETTPGAIERTLIQHLFSGDKARESEAAYLLVHFDSEAAQSALKAQAKPRAEVRRMPVSEFDKQFDYDLKDLLRERMIEHLKEKIGELRRARKEGQFVDFPSIEDPAYWEGELIFLLPGMGEDAARMIANAREKIRESAGVERTVAYLIRVLNGLEGAPRAEVREQKKEMGAGQAEQARKILRTGEVEADVKKIRTGQAEAEDVEKVLGFISSRAKTFPELMWAMRAEYQDLVLEGKIFKKVGRFTHPGLLRDVMQEVEGNGVSGKPPKDLSEKFERHEGERFIDKPEHFFDILRNSKPLQELIRRKIEDLERRRSETRFAPPAEAAVNVPETLDKAVGIYNPRLNSSNRTGVVLGVAREALFQILSAGLLNILNRMSTDAYAAVYQEVLDQLMPEKAGREGRFEIPQDLSGQDRAALEAVGILPVPGRVPDNTFGLSVVPADSYTVSDLIFAGMILSRYSNKLLVVAVKGKSEEELRSLNEFSKENLKGQVFLIPMHEQGYAKTVDNLFQGNRKEFPQLEEFRALANGLANKAGRRGTMTLKDLGQHASIAGTSQELRDNLELFPRLNLLQSRLIDENLDQIFKGNQANKLSFIATVSLMVAGVEMVRAEYLRELTARNLDRIDEIDPSRFNATFAPQINFITALAHLRDAAEALAVAA